MGETEGRLLGFARHPDARVRQIAVETAALLNDWGASGLVPHILLASLYDTTDHVAVVGLRGSRSEGGNLPTEDALVTAIQAAYTFRSRIVRAEAIVTARTLGERLSDPRIEGLVESALADRSWIVREAATSEHG